MKEIERWKPVVGYEGIYEVSDHGNVRSLDRPFIDSLGRKGVRPGRELKPRAITSGHLQVSLSQDGQVSWRYVHRLMLEAFRGTCPPGHEACHYDDDPTNNQLSNLRWGTKSENSLDMVRNGNHRNAKKTHCPQGHEYDDENTLIYRGKRYCRACARDRRQARRREAYRYQGHLTGRRTR